MVVTLLVLVLVLISELKWRKPN